jgi:hypothetical protein
MEDFYKLDQITIGDVEEMTTHHFFGVFERGMSICQSMPLF